MVLCMARNLVEFLSGLLGSCSSGLCCLLGMSGSPATRLLCLAGRSSLRLGISILVWLNQRGILRIVRSRHNFPLGRCRTAAVLSLAGRPGSWGSFRNNLGGSNCTMGLLSLARIACTGLPPSGFRMGTRCIAEYLSLAGIAGSLAELHKCRLGIPRIAAGLRMEGRVHIVRQQGNFLAGMLGILVLHRLPGI
jgi:hypothetical protein